MHFFENKCFFLEKCAKICLREFGLRGEGLQEENIEKTTDDNNGMIANKRRKRINRMKTTIIAIILILIILFTICCIILGIQVSRLQKQVDAFSVQNTDIDLSKDTTHTSENYAFAAERPVTTSEDIDNQINSSEVGDFESIDNSIEGAEIVLSQTTPEENIENTPLEIEQTTENANRDDSNVVSDKKETNKGNEITISNIGIYSGKEVYLTFDDGPSAYTEDVLDILAKYQVKATFFVVGKTDMFSKKMYQRIVEEGHTLGMHSYSHVYKNIYNSVEDFDKDFTKLWKLLYDTTGYKPTIFRFPGGSANRVNAHGMDDFIRYLNDNAFVYFDWNALNGDATDVEYTKEQLIDNVLDGVSIKKISIVLMHDSETKRTTRDSLSELLETLISGGAEILPLDKEVKPIQQIKFDSIK